MSSAQEAITARRSEATLTLHCPGCGAPAAFREPFLYLRGGPAREAERDPDIEGVRVHDGYMVALYPTLLAWSDEARQEVRGRAPNSLGIIDCRACGLLDRHHLRWPRDLYYRYQERGEAIWAYHLAHAIELVMLLELIREMPEVVELLGPSAEAQLPEALRTKPVVTRAIEHFRTLLEQPG